MATIARLEVHDVCHVAWQIDGSVQLRSTKGSHLLVDPFSVLVQVLIGLTAALSVHAFLSKSRISFIHYSFSTDHRYSFQFTLPAISRHFHL